MYSSKFSFWRSVASFLVLGCLACRAASGAEEVVGHRWAVLIGVNNYAYVEDLRFCSRDMAALRDKLVATGFPPNQVYLLQDGATDPRFLPNKVNIQKQLETVLSLAAPEDLVMVAFAGHGVHIDGVSYLCPSEAMLERPTETLVSMETIYSQLEHCRAALKLFVVDACRNDPRPAGRRSASSKPDTRQLSATFERPPQGILVLSSCAPGQVSFEDEQMQHGVFTNYLLEGLSGKADSNGNKMVSLMELYEYAGFETKSFVARRFTNVQTPALRGEINGIFEIGLLSSNRPVGAYIPVGPGMTRSTDFRPSTTLPTRVGGTFTNSIGMKLAYIPAGTFNMGANTGEVTAWDAKNSRFYSLRDEPDETQHQVHISRPFFMGVYEVTQYEYERVMGENPSKFPRGGQGTESTAGLDPTRFPVEQVSWDDANEFCRRLSNFPAESVEGRGYRLPFEAEWEYACRAGTKTPYYFAGGGVALTARGANCNGLSPFGTLTKGPFLQRTTVVGSYIEHANPFGLFDMHGNVQEWCLDWYDSGYYTKSPANDPKGPTSGTSRVLRGGGWASRCVQCRSADRAFAEPERRSSFIGFRVVCVQ